MSDYSMSSVKGAKKTDFLALVSAKAEQVLPTMEGPPPLREGEEAVTVVFEHKGPLGMSLQLIAADGGLDNAGVWATGGRVLLSAGISADMASVRLPILDAMPRVNTARSLPRADAAV